MSSDWENEKAIEIVDATDDSIRVHRCGYSGNNAFPQPDLLITAPMQNYGLELKGPIQSEYCYIEEDDIEQLVEYENAHTSVWLVVKFSRREPLVVRYWDELTTSQADAASVPDDFDEQSPAEKLATLVPDCFDPRVTDSGALALTKPPTDEWPSATKGSSDVDAILSGIGVVTEKSRSVSL